MPMPQEIYHALNRAFQEVREGEREAVELERQAKECRDNAFKAVKEVYDKINAAFPTLPEK